MVFKKMETAKSQLIFGYPRPIHSVTFIGMTDVGKRNKYSVGIQRRSQL